MSTLDEDIEEHARVTARLAWQKDVLTRAMEAQIAKAAELLRRLEEEQG